MKKNFSKLIGLILMTALLAVMAMLLPSCGGEGSGASEIYVSKADLPRVDYVEGQELDLSKGKLTVIIDGEESMVPLTAPEVTVTGYDADTVGEQVLTVTYKEMTTTFKINVAPRTVAENYATKYFVGSEFNPAKGRIKITTDDAKTFTVNMSDSTVSLVSFDSSAAGTATVTLLYNNGVNSYYCQFDVTVYEQSNIKFVPPSRTNYVSHDASTLYVDGGFFEVTSSDGSLTMNVPLTEKMVEGFDPTKASFEHKETPLEQELTVNYLGKEFHYNVYITFSGVSEIEYYANEVLSKIDWAAAKNGELSEEQSKAALAAATQYYDLSSAEREKLSPETVSLVGRAGALAVNQELRAELETYTNSFRFNEEGSLFLMRTGYEQTKADVQRLNDPEEKINVYASLLRQIVTEFGELNVTEDTLVKNAVFVYSAEVEESLKASLNHLVDVFTLLKDIPADWNAETLKPYGDKILSAVMQIYSAGYYKQGYAGYYTNILSPWRAGDDVFDILYTYFLYDYENNAEFMSTYMWGSMPMPGLLDDWYTSLKTCMSYSAVFKSYASAGKYLVDVSPYMYNYFRTLEICEEIKSSNNQFWIDIYTIYNGDSMNKVYLDMYSYGYLYHTKGMVDSEAYRELWEAYYVLLKHYDDQSLSASLHRAEILEMYKAFDALSPSELLGFLSSLSLMYTSGNGAYPMLGYAPAVGEDGKETVYNVFSYILSNYYASYLTEGNSVLFNDLLSAMETFALIGYKDGAVAEFNAKMDVLSKKIFDLSGEDLTNFETYFKGSFDKYYALYLNTSGQTSVTFTDAERALINQYIGTLEDYFGLYGSIYSLIQQGYSVADEAYTVLYALYARASELRATMYSTMTLEKLLTLYTAEYQIAGATYTLEHAYYLVDTVTLSVLNSMSAVVTGSDGRVSYATYWEVYEANDMQQLLSKYAYVLFYSYFDEGEAVSAADFLAFITELREFGSYKTSVVVLLNVDDTFYKAMERYYGSVLTADGSAACGEIVKAARAYTDYKLGATAENLAAFLSAVDQMSAKYETLSAADKAQLESLYNYYVALAESLDESAAA